MAKQHSDNIEDRFREAAENISFPPNEEAWNKMEALLDKDKRRRPVFAWWFLLLAVVLTGTGVIAYRHFGDSGKRELVGDGLTFQNTEKTDRSATDFPARPEAGLREPDRKPKIPAASGEPGGSAQNSETKEDSKVSGSMNRTDDESQRRSKNQRPVENLNQPGTSAGTGASLHSDPDVTSRRKNVNAASFTGTGKSSKRSAGNKRNQRGSFMGKAATGEKNSDKSASTTELPESDQSKNADGKVNNNSVQNRPGSDPLLKTTEADSPSRSQTTDSASADKKMSKPDSVVNQSPPIRVSTSSKKWLLDKGFNISLGTRIDATDLHRISLHRFNQLAAGSVGYRFSNRLSIQAGVVVQKAVYYAGPADYYVKPGSYLSMYRISKIDAICQIYEIPLSVRYDILIGKGLRIYGVGGLSSFYLKKENYRYHATGSSGYRMFDSTYRANKNYFSSAYLAAGVEKKITRVFSILAEPYAKLPVSGIGAGKVKLYSGGIQVMLRYQPQAGKKSSGVK